MSALYWDNVAVFLSVTVMSALYWDNVAVSSVIRDGLVMIGMRDMREFSFNATLFLSFAVQNAKIEVSKSRKISFYKLLQ